MAQLYAAARPPCPEGHPGQIFLEGARKRAASGTPGTEVARYARRQLGRRNPGVLRRGLDRGARTAGAGLRDDLLQRLLRARSGGGIDSASAFFATDFYAGAATLVDGLLARPDLPYGSLFAADPRFDPAGLDALPHPYAAGSELWLHRSPYFDGKVDYWYAFAGGVCTSRVGYMIT